MEEVLKQILAEIQTVNVRLDNMQTNISDLQSKQDALTKDMAKHNHYVEPLLKTVKDGVDGLQERHNQVDRLEDKVDAHDHRIWALEQVVKAK